MNLKAFLVDALGGALDIGLGAPEDVLRFVTPDLLAQSLPRPLWARLLTACLGASKVDATLIVDTIGVANLVEHMPAQVMWNVVADIATKALGGAVRPVAIPTVPATQNKPATQSGALPQRIATPPRGIAATAASTPSRGVPLAPPPPANEPPARPTPQPPSPAAKTAIPAPGSQSLANLDLDDEDRPSSPAGRARTPTGQRFRQSQTGIGRMTSASTAARRPQAQAQVPAPAARNQVRRGGTEVSELETETSVEKDWGDKEIAVDDEQLVDWQSTDETVTGAESLNRKR